MSISLKEYMDDLKHRFDFHPADKKEIQNAHEDVRKECLLTADYLAGKIPQCRELALAVTKLEEAMMWGNAGIARHGLREKEEGEE